MSYSARCRNLLTKNAREELLRHAAAEIAAEADATIAELVEALEAAEPQLIGPARLAALAALANAKRT